MSARRRARKAPQADGGMGAILFRSGGEWESGGVACLELIEMPNLIRVKSCDQQRAKISG